MAIDTSMQGRDLYLRSTDHEGRVTKSFHRVWDAERFMRARENEAANLNADKRSTKASATQITREQYQARSA